MSSDSRTFWCEPKSPASISTETQSEFEEKMPARVIESDHHRTQDGILDPTVPEEEEEPQKTRRTRATRPRDRWGTRLGEYIPLGFIPKTGTLADEERREGKKEEKGRKRIIYTCFGGSIHCSAALSYLGRCPSMTSLDSPGPFTFYLVLYQIAIAYQHQSTSTFDQSKLYCEAIDAYACRGFVTGRKDASVLDQPLRRPAEVTFSSSVMQGRTPPLGTHPEPPREWSVARGRSRRDH